MDDAPPHPLTVLKRSHNILDTLAATSSSSSTYHHDVSSTFCCRQRPNVTKLIRNVSTNQRPLTCTAAHQQEATKKPGLTFEELSCCSSVLVEDQRLLTHANFILNVLKDTESEGGKKWTCERVNTLTHTPSPLTNKECLIPAPGHQVLH